MPKGLKGIPYHTILKWSAEICGRLLTNMKKKSELPGNKEKSKSITSQKNAIPIDKLSKILGIPEEKLKDLPEFVLKKIIEVTIEKESYYEGPLPSPNVVSKYEKILPGAFDRILRLTEQNAQHRIEIDKHEMELEKTLVPESIEIRKAGQSKAFIITILGIIAVCFCAYIGEATIGSILAGTTLIALVPNFISGIKKTKELKTENNQK